MPKSEKIITLNVCQGIGDIIWVYQKFSPYFDRINFNICTIPNGDPKIQTRAENFLYLLPKVGYISYKELLHHQYERLCHKKFPIDAIIKRWARGKRLFDYGCNYPLEKGIRIEDIDSKYPISYNLGFNFKPFAPLVRKKYIVVYISGSTENPAVIEQGAWDLNKWMQFVEGFYLRYDSKRPIVLIGASYDQKIQNEFSTMLWDKGIKNELYIDLDPAHVIYIIKNAQAYVGYQSGLSILADLFDVKQVMLYYSWLEKLMYAWPKNKNIKCKRYNAFLWNTPVECIINQLPSKFI